MRILMLGWEFPPFMSGGLGTAVEGLTRSLVSRGHEVVFVLPQPVPEGHKSHVELIGPRILAQRAAAIRAGGGSQEIIETVHRRASQQDEAEAARLQRTIS